MPIFSIGGRTPRFVGSHHYVAHDADLIGDVTLENDVNIWFQVVIRAENDRIHLGEGSNVQDGCVLHVDPGYPLTLARNVSIGHKVMLHGCTIGEGTLVGINSVIMNGAKIGRGSLIGANTLIPEGKEIPDGVLVIGSPGKVVRELNQEDRDYLLKIAAGYVERSKAYRRELREVPLPPSTK
jgi:carbonic anhydrase/acetyltransferase-like protein (isoleucine patch superfamily)